MKRDIARIIAEYEQHDKYSIDDSVIDDEGHDNDGAPQVYGTINGVLLEINIVA